MLFKKSSQFFHPNVWAVITNDNVLSYTTFWMQLMKRKMIAASGRSSSKWDMDMFKYRIGHKFPGLPNEVGNATLVLKFDDALATCSRFETVLRYDVKGEKFVLKISMYGKGSEPIYTADMPL